MRHSSGQFKMAQNKPTDRRQKYANEWRSVLDRPMFTPGRHVHGIPDLDPDCKTLYSTELTCTLVHVYPSLAKWLCIYLFHHTHATLVWFVDGESRCGQHSRIKTLHSVNQQWIATFAAEAQWLVVVLLPFVAVVAWVLLRWFSSGDCCGCVTGRVFHKTASDTISRND